MRMAPAGAADASTVVCGSDGNGEGVGARVGGWVATSDGDAAAAAVADEAEPAVSDAGDDALEQASAMNDIALARARVKTPRSHRSPGPTNVRNFVHLPLPAAI